MPPSRPQVHTRYGCQPATAATPHQVGRGWRSPKPILTHPRPKTNEKIPKISFAGHYYPSYTPDEAESFKAFGVSCRWGRWAGPGDSFQGGMDAFAVQSVPGRGRPCRGAEAATRRDFARCETGELRARLPSPGFSPRDAKDSYPRSSWLVQVCRFLGCAGPLRLQVGIGRSHVDFRCWPARWRIVGRLDDDRFAHGRDTAFRTTVDGIPSA